MHLGIEKRIKILTGYKTRDKPVLSIYLGDDSKKSMSSEIFITKYNSLLKKMTKKEKDMFREEIRKIKNYLKENLDTRSLKNITFFASGGFLWEVVPFAFYIQTLYKIRDKPYLEPILNALNEQKKYLVLLVDHEKARIFTVHFGKIEEHFDVFNESVPQRVKAINKAWMRQDKIFRHIEDHLNRHLVFIAEKVKEFVEKNNVNFIVLGGHKELFEKIKVNLPQKFKKRVSGAFVTELNIPINSVYLKVKKMCKL